MTNKFKANTVILINIDTRDSKKRSKDMQGEFIENYKEHEYLIDLEEGTDYFIYDNNDFLYEVNEGNLDIEDYFVVFANTPL